MKFRLERQQVGIEWHAMQRWTGPIPTTLFSYNHT